MSYTPTNWQTGDTITAEKLNKLEEGVANLSGYDLKVVILATTGGSYSLSSLNGISYASILQKYNNMEFINACFVMTFDDGTKHSIYPTKAVQIDEDTGFIAVTDESDSDISISETSIVLNGSVTYTYTYDTDTMEYTLTQTS